MTTFRQILEQHLAVEDGRQAPEKINHLSSDWDRFWLNLVTEVRVQSPELVSIPSRAEEYVSAADRLKKKREQTQRQIDEHRKRKRLDEWSRERPQLFEAYKVFAFEGEWDFAPAIGRLQLKTIYRRILLKVHPDLNGGERTGRTRSVIAAYNTIKKHCL